VYVIQKQKPDFKILVQPAQTFTPMILQLYLHYLIL